MEVKSECMAHTRLLGPLKSDRTGVSPRQGARAYGSERSIHYTATDRSSHSAAAVLVFLLATGSVFVVRAVAQEQQFHPRPNSIRGTVINGVTHEPIGRALVYTQDNRFAAWSDSDGHFEYPLPKALINDTGFLGVVGPN